MIKSALENSIAYLDYFSREMKKTVQKIMARRRLHPNLAGYPSNGSLVEEAIQSFKFDP
jgi:hypothetical protein